MIISNTTASKIEFDKRLYFNCFLLILWFFISSGSILMLGLKISSVFVLLFLFITASILMANKFGIKAVLYLLLVILPLQPFFTMPFSTELTNNGVKMFVSLKEILIILLLLLLIKKSVLIQLNRIDYSALFFFSVYTYSLFKSGFGFPQLVSYREGSLLVLLYFTGRLLYYSGIKSSDIILVTFNLTIILVLFGLFERFILGSSFWEYWGALDYLQTKFSSGLVMIRSVEGIPANWFTNIGDGWYRRIVSTVADAPSFSRYISFSISAFLFFKYLRTKHISYFLFFLSISCLFLTFGRGGILIFICALSLLILNSNIKYKYVTTFPLLLIALVLLLSINLLDINSSVAVRHLTGLKAGFTKMLENYSGHGLGSSGQLAILYTENINEKISESYIGGLSYQLGILGVLTYSVWIAILLFFLYRKYTFLKIDNLDIAHQALFAFAMIFGVYLTSFVSNSAVSPISCANIFLIVGLTISELHNKNISIN